MKRRKLRRKRKLHKQNKKLRFNEAFDVGFNDGFNKGFNKGYNKGHDFGFHDGMLVAMKRDDHYHVGYEIGYDESRYMFADQPVEAALPENTILPEYPQSEIVKTGVLHSQAYWLKLLDREQVSGCVSEALALSKPLAIIRLGDGELLTLAQESVYSIDEVKRLGPFLKYAGVDVPDLDARDQVLSAIKAASIIGIPDKRLKTFQPLAFQVFRAYGIDYRPLSLCSSLINYQLMESGLLPQLLSNRRIVIIGNMAGLLAKAFKKQKFIVSGIIDSVQGFADIPTVMNEIVKFNFDVALVSAGVPAVVITQRIASELGKVAIDFGHMADRFVQQVQ